MAAGRTTSTIALFLLLSAATAHAQILSGVLEARPAVSSAALDASCSGYGTSSPVSCSTAMIVSKGDTILCSASQHSYGIVGFYISDNSNGVYQAVGNVLLEDAGHYGASWVRFNSASGKITPTVTTTDGATGLLLTCNAWRNAAPFASIDGGPVTQFSPAAGTGTTGANPTAGLAQLPANAGEGIDCTMWNLNGAAPAAGSGYVLSAGVNASSIYQWPEHQIQSTPNPANCPYTAAADTWTDFAVGVLSAAAATGGVSPFTGIFTDGHGISDGTPVTADNLNAGSYSSVYSVWAECQNVTGMQWSSQLGIPNRLHPLWVNGSNAAGNTGIGLTHANSADTESCQLQVYSNPASGESELSIDEQLVGYTNNLEGDICDTSRIANALTGDTETIQWFYDTNVFSGPAVRLEDNSGVTNASIGIGLPNFTDWYSMRLRLVREATVLNLTAAANASGGQTVYTGTITGGANNGLVGQWFTVSGFATAANNNHVPAGLSPITLANGWPVIASTATTLALANPAGVAETHAATATIDHILQVWDATTGTFVGTDSSPVQSSGPVSGWITVNVGGQGSCGMNQPGSITNYGYIAVNPLTTSTNYPTTQ